MSFSAKCGNGIIKAPGFRAICNGSSASTKKTLIILTRGATILTRIGGFSRRSSKMPACSMRCTSSTTTARLIITSMHRRGKNKRQRYISKSSNKWHQRHRLRPPRTLLILRTRNAKNATNWPPPPSSKNNPPVPATSPSPNKPPATSAASANRASKRPSAACVSRRRTVRVSVWIRIGGSTQIAKNANQ